MSKKIVKYLSRIGILFCLFCSPAFHAFGAELCSNDSCDATDHPLTIAELINIALKNNPSTKRVYWNAQRAAAMVGIAESAYYPQLSAEGVAQYGKNHGVAAETTKYGADLTLNMLLYDFGKTNASAEATKKLLQAASWNVDWNVQHVLVQVFETAYNTLYAQEVYDATLISVNEAEKMFEAARELNRVGLKPVSDVYTTQATLSSLKIDLSTRKQFLQESEAKLAITLGLQPTTSITVQPVNITAAPKKELLDQLISCANEHRADLQEKQARYTAALCEVQKERAAAWPEFSIFGREGIEKTHHKTKDETCHSVHQNSKSRQYDIGIKVEIPLFTGFDLMYKKRAALAAANLSKAEIIELQLEISRDVAIATYSLESAQEKLPYAQDHLENATKAYECTLDRYIAGRAEIAELYNAQQQIASARIQYGTVKTQWLTAIANLAYATGTIR